MTVEQTLVDSVAAVAASTPDRLAVSDGRRDLTYGDLDREARRVAVALRAAAGPRVADGTSETVAMLVGQDVAAVVGLLGIWRAGLVAVPLDRGQPIPVRDELLVHAGARLVLIDGDEPASLPTDVVTVRVDASPEDAADRPLPAGSAEAPAAVYYTSGTTGRPKGLVISHGSQLLGTRSWCEAYGLAADDRVGLAFHHSFGASRVALLGALVAGAPLHVYDVPALGIAGFVDALQRDRITFVHAAPAVLRAMSDELSTPTRGEVGLPELRTFVIGAEGIRPGDVERFRSAFSPACTLVYSYAVSEAGPIAAHRIESTTPIDDGPLPVGRPLPGKEVRIVAPDVTGTGEIVVSGVGLADGYWRDPDRTAERFSTGPDVVDGDAPATTFHTGDLGRLRPDGVLEFRGRTGSLVKLRGYSVDTGLVEGALVAAMHAREAVVVVEERARPRLVAYVVPGDDPDAPSVPEVRASLAQRLPSYMVPAVVVPVDAIPRTSRGKVAPADLPPVPSGRPEVSTPYVAPTDDLERSLVAVWERVLDVAPIGVADDFFALGGDSLAAAESVAAMAATCGVAVPLAAFVDAPTVAGIAAVARGDRQRWSSTVVPMRVEGELPPFCCVHGAWGGILNLGPLAARLGPDQPFYAIQLTTEASRGPLSQVEVLAAGYLASLRRVLPSGPYVLSGFSFGGVVAIEMARQLAAEGEPPPLVVLLDTTSPAQARRRRAKLSTWARVRSTLGLRLRWAAWRRLGWRGKLRLNLVSKRAVRRYQPGPYPGRVLFVRATVPEVPLEDQGHIGWDEIVRGPFEVVEVAAEHVQLMDPPAIDEVAELVSGAIRDATASVTTG